MASSITMIAHATARPAANAAATRARDAASARVAAMSKMPPPIAKAARCIAFARLCAGTADHTALNAPHRMTAMPQPTEIATALGIFGMCWRAANAFGRHANAAMAASHVVIRGAVATSGRISSAQAGSAYAGPKFSANLSMIALVPESSGAGKGR